MCSRTGAFPSVLARYYILKYSEEGETVLDPFSGKGTAPFEACIYNRIGIGSDAAPDAFVLTKAKVNARALIEVEEFIKELGTKISSTEVSTSSVDSDIKQFFHPDTLKQILALRGCILGAQDDLSTLVKGIILGILHGSSQISLSIPCMHSFSMAPTYVRKYVAQHNLKAPLRNPISCMGDKAKKVFADSIPKQKGKALESDARHIAVDSDSVDLIITSPPYFNKQTYAWDNWLRLWFLGYPDHREIEKKLFRTSSAERYLEFSRDWLKEAYRVLKEDTACIVVVGDVKLNGETVNTAEQLIAPAEEVGFSVSRIVEDSFGSQIGFTHLFRRNNPTALTQKNIGRTFDRIIELHKGKVSENNVAINWQGMNASEARLR